MLPYQVKTHRGHKVEADKPALIDRWALMRNGHTASSAEPASFYPPQRLGEKGGDERGLAFQEIARGKGPDARFGYAHSSTSIPSPRKQAFYCPKTLVYISVALGKSSRGRPRQGVQEPMNHDAAVPKDPATVAEVIPVRKPMKYLGTLLSTEQEEISNADGTKKRLTTVRRSVRR